jgi:hypothetical protein
MVQSATRSRKGIVHAACAVAALLIGAAAASAPAAAHERRVVVVERPAAYYVRPYGPPAAVPYYAMPYYSGPAVAAPVYYAPAPAPVYNGSAIELMFSFGGHDRHDNGHHRGWDHHDRH